MNVEKLIQQVRALGVTVRYSDGKIYLGNQEVLTPELWQYLRMFQDDIPTYLEVEEISRQLTNLGCVLVHSKILNDYIAFIRPGNEHKVPRGFIAYSEDELHRYFVSGASAYGKELRLVHRKKKKQTRIKEFDELCDMARENQVGVSNTNGNHPESNADTAF